MNLFDRLANKKSVHRTDGINLETDELSDEVLTAREKQAAARRAVHAALDKEPEAAFRVSSSVIEGVISAGQSPEKSQQKQIDTKQVLSSPFSGSPKVEGGVSVELRGAEKGDPAVEEKPVLLPGGHVVSAHRDWAAFATRAMASGQKLIDENGKPVIETKTALVAPAALWMNDDKRRERIEAMVDHAAKKFDGKPLRLEGNEKFVGMAIDAALARGLTVEVSAKHKDLLEAKLREREQQKEKGAPTVEGVISAGRAPEKEITSEERLVTGKLVGFSIDPDAQGRRHITITRAGQDVTVTAPADHVKADDLKPLIGKAVQFQAASEKGPARVVGLEQKKQQSRDPGRGIEI